MPGHRSPLDGPNSASVWPWRGGVGANPARPWPSHPEASPCQAARRACERFLFAVLPFAECLVLAARCVLFFPGDRLAVFFFLAAAFFAGECFAVRLFFCGGASLGAEGVCSGTWAGPAFAADAA